MMTRLYMLLLATGMALMLMACGEGSGAPSSPQNAETPQEPMRVVTLAPALTQMVVDLDLAQTLVGVAEHDAAAPDGLPVVGNYLDINSEKLLTLKPTHVLTMTGKGGVPPALRELAAAGHFKLSAYPSPLSVGEALDVLYQEDESPDQPSVGTVLGVRDRARALREKTQQKLDHIREVTASADHTPRVLMVIGTGPIMASAGGTTHDELLTQYLNAINVAGDASVTAPTFDREKLLAAAPDVVLMILPGAAPLGTLDQDPRLADLLVFSLASGEEHRVELIDHPLAHLPSTSLDDVAMQMAMALYPELADKLSTIP